MNYYIVKSENNGMAFSPVNGAIASLKRGECEQLKESSELFTLHFRTKSSERLSLHGREFSHFSFDGETFLYSGNGQYPGLQIKIMFRAEKGFFYFRPLISGIPEGMRLELIDVPQLTTTGSGTVLLPYSEGVMISDPMKGLPYFQPDSPECYADYYPGICQMQFLAYLSHGTGVYFGAHDPTHAPKRILNYRNESMTLRLSLETFCGTAQNDAYISAFEYVVGTFSGDWMDAAGIYRDWIKYSEQIKVRNDLPEWFEDSPVTIIYPVRGDGKITSEPNEYFPYMNAMPHIKNIAEKTNSRVMAVLMRWDQFGPWLPPYIWPPMGGESELANFSDALHEQGYLLGLYGSGTAWTQNSLTNDYSGATEFEEKKLAQVMTRRPDGKLDYYSFSGIRNGYHLCLTEKWSRETLKKQVSDIAAAGIDFLQFFDQNLGGTSFMCYADTHTHPLIPGDWLTKSMKSLIEEMNHDTKSANHKMLLGTECAPAEPYINELPFNDLRPTFVLGLGMPVPLYQFIFHEYLNNFMGNQVFASKYIDCEKSPENLLWRIAYAFNSGEMLSVTLRNHGIVDWSVATDWNSSPPDQDSALQLIGNLNCIRRKYPQFLRYGKMLKPELGISGGKYSLHLRKLDDPYLCREACVEEIDSFTSSCWESPDGSLAQIITNFLPEVQKVICALKSNWSYKINGISQEEEFEVELPALSAVVLNIHKKRIL